MNFDRRAFLFGAAGAAAFGGGGAVAVAAAKPAVVAGQHIWLMPGGSVPPGWSYTIKNGGSETMTIHASAQEVILAPGKSARF